VSLTRTERVLRIFTEVRPGEGRTALVMFANVFLILSAYYLIKPLREGWISISEVGSLSKMEVKAYSAFGQSLLLLGVVHFYGRLSARVNRARLIVGATLFCMSNMVVFWALQPDFFLAHLPGPGVAFYLWVGMFGVFIVAQFWTYAADLYDDERGNRLIPMIAIGATAGGAFGSQITEVLVSSGLVPTKFLLLAALVPLAASVFLTRWAERRGPVGAGPEPSTSGPPEPSPGIGDGARSRESLSTVLNSRYLLLVALITLLMNWVNTNGENVLFHVVQETLAEQAVAQGLTEAEEIRSFTQDQTTLFYSNFFRWVNWVALLLQALVASRLLKYGGFGAILMLLPAIALVSYGTMALLPVLAVIKLMKIAENGTDYSINNTARHVLWLPVSAEMKYKGKPTVDTLFARLGDGLAALTVLVGERLLDLPTKGFLAFTVLLVLLWIGQAAPVVGEHRRLCREQGIDNV
jgi:AAA family ATP:ADP antiporter